MKLEQMPVLRPIPISTDCSYWGKIKAWRRSPRKWMLEKNWEYTLLDGTTIIIEKGFVFDGASIPRIFWPILSPTGILLVPGLIHDHGYKYDYIMKKNGGKITGSKPTWDMIFLREARVVNGLRAMNLIAWLAVSIFGWIPYGKYRKEVF